MGNALPAQPEMDDLVRQAGFEKLQTLTDEHGIFTVSLARTARCLVAHGIPAREFPRTPAAPVLAFGARLISGARTLWFDSFPEDGQRIYYANHTSHLDAAVLWAALPAGLRARTRPVAARDYWSGGARAYIATRIFRAVLIERPGRSAAEIGLGGRAMLDPALEALDQGSSLIVFPEGSRGDGHAIGPFKSGIYHLARLRPDVKLQPVYLENLNRILPKGEFLPVPLLSRVIFGPCLSIQAGEDRDAFLARVREALCALASV